MMRADTELHRPYTGMPAGVIPLQYHVPMLLDEHRMTSFKEAIAAVVRPGMHVLDLGAGTGVLSYFAAERGATVTAVEREPLVFAAASSALRAAGGRVTLIHADAATFVPDRPVDVVICEMMHVGQLREQQIAVIGAFKSNYRRAFPDAPMPVFLPAACLQAVQPVQQDFTYYGYAVAAPQFQDPFSVQDRTVQLAPPQIFQSFFYTQDLPERCESDLTFTAERSGWVNAVRVVTNNILAAGTSPDGPVQWRMNYLVVPLPAPLYAEPGDAVRISFSYRPGDQIDALASSVRAEPVS